MYFIQQINPRGAGNTVCTSDLRNAVDAVKGMTFLRSTAIIFTLDKDGNEEILDDYTG